MTAVILDSTSQLAGVETQLIGVILMGLSAREQGYIKQLIPEARQNVKASLNAYQNTTGELNTVLRASSSELTIQLERLQLQVDRAKSRATLMYLEGVVK